MVGYKARSRRQFGSQYYNINIILSKMLLNSDVSFRRQFNRHCGLCQNKNKLIPADHGRVVVDGDTGRVHFKPLRKEDEGDYTCVAINDVGETKSTAFVRVLGSYLTTTS